MRAGTASRPPRAAPLPASSPSPSSVAPPFPPHRSHTHRWPSGEKTVMARSYLAIGKRKRGGGGGCDPHCAGGRARGEGGWARGGERGALSFVFDERVWPDADAPPPSLRRPFSAGAARPPPLSPHTHTRTRTRHTRAHTSAQRRTRVPVILPRPQCGSFGGRACPRARPATGAARSRRGRS